MMPPAADADHRELWDEVNALKGDLREHVGGYKSFREDVVRRQEEGMRDRHGLNLKIDSLTESVHKLEAKMMGLMLSGVGSALVVVIGIIIQVVKK